MEHAAALQRSCPVACMAQAADDVCVLQDIDAERIRHFARTVVVVVFHALEHQLGAIIDVLDCVHELDEPDPILEPDLLHELVIHERVLIHELDLLHDPLVSTSSILSSNSH